MIHSLRQVNGSFSCLRTKLKNIPHPSNSNGLKVHKWRKSRDPTTNA